MKYKNTIAMLIMTSILGVSVSADSVNIDTEKIEPAVKEEISHITKDNLKDNEKDRSIFDTGSTDIVTINGEDLFDVQTELLGCQLQVPFGWLCLTQDFKLQYDTFNYIYNDPLAQAKEMVSSGQHYFLLDYDFENMIEVYFSEDYLGTIVGNAADLEKEDDEAVFDIVNRNYYPKQDGEIGNYGPNHFYHFWNDNKSKHFYETYVNEICVDIYLTNLSGEEIEDYILEDMDVILAGMGFAS